MSGTVAALALMDEVGAVVVKPARGEQGRGITVGAREAGLERVVGLGPQFCPDILGDGRRTVGELVESTSRRERVGLANHEPQPVAERFVDLLFPETRRR